MYLAIYGESGLGHEVLDLAIHALKHMEGELEQIFLLWIILLELNTGHSQYLVLKI